VYQVVVSAWPVTRGQQVQQVSVRFAGMASSQVRGDVDKRRILSPQVCETGADRSMIRNIWRAEVAEGQEALRTAGLETKRYDLSPRASLRKKPPSQFGRGLLCGVLR